MNNNQQQPPIQRTLVKKLAEIMREVGRIPKNGYNSHQKYNYVMESDISEAVRSLMADRNLMIFPNLVSKEVISAGTTKGGSSQWLTSVEMEFTIVDGDSGEERTVKMGGQGIDSGDKGIFKATTGANKYALLKLFQISTGDDPENDGGVNHQQQPRQQQRPQGQGNNNRRQQQPPAGGQAPQGNGQRIPSYNDARKLAERLGWDERTMMTNINKLRNMNGAAPIQKWNDGEPNFKTYFMGWMNDLLKRQGGAR